MSSRWNPFSSPGGWGPGQSPGSFFEGPRRVFIRVFRPDWPVGFRWMLLLAVLLVFGRPQDVTTAERLGRVLAFVLAVSLHELLHWFLSGWFFPGMPRRIILAPLGGPAPLPNTPSLTVVFASLCPALLGALLGGITVMSRVEGFLGALGTFAMVVSVVNFLPFWPLDGHVWFSAIIRATKIYWRYPAWREYLGAVGGVAVALSPALWDPLGAAELLFVGGISVLIDNLYMLKLRRAQEQVRTGPTGFPSPGRVEPDDKKRMDEILERVSKEGIDAVSPEDRDFLEQMSQRFRKH